MSSATHDTNMSSNSREADAQYMFLLEQMQHRELTQADLQLLMLLEQQRANSNLPPFGSFPIGHDHGQGVEEGLEHGPRHGHEHGHGDGSRDGVSEPVEPSWDTAHAAATEAGGNEARSRYSFGDGSRLSGSGPPS